MHIIYHSFPGISIEQFKAFNTFLSNIDDFLIAVAMTNSSGQDINKEFFGRAVHVVTGKNEIFMSFGWLSCLLGRWNESSIET